MHSVFCEWFFINFNRAAAEELYMYLLNKFFFLFAFLCVLFIELAFLGFSSVLELIC